jgi:hypothetical protein
MKWSVQCGYSVDLWRSYYTDYIGYPLYINGHKLPGFNKMLAIKRQNETIFLQPDFFIQNNYI